VDWIQLSQNEVQWQTFMNTVMSLLEFTDQLGNYQLVKDSSPWN
jgi:hypothetical protein